jgi:hypothetical protein
LATISNTPRPGYVWDATDNVWYPIGVGAHQHTNAADTPAVMPYSTYAAAGKNKIINGDFGIWQRGTSLALNSSYTYLADRFKTTGRNGSGTQSQYSLTTGESALCANLKYAYKLAMTSAATNVTPTIAQVVEDSFPYYGKTMTLSFYAKASKAITLQSAPDLIWANADNQPSTVNHSLTTTFQRFTHTFTITPSGTYNSSTDYGLILPFYAPMNDTYDIYITGIQLEAGSTVTAFQTATGNPASELAACQRYYCRLQRDGASSSGRVFPMGSALSTTSVAVSVPFIQTMRTSPTAVEYASMRAYDGAGFITLTSITFGDASNSYASIALNASSGFTTYRPTWPALDSNGYIAFSAEL